jgi:hypothetical protein
MRVDFIKLDIEGMELEAISGARRTISTFHPMMLIEAIKSDQAALSAALLSMGYRLFRLDINVLAVHETDPSLERVSASP